jgi:hypothetical protein
VVITSNGEREFPPAFLRRCLRLDLPDPDEPRLRAIVSAHLGPEAVPRPHPRIPRPTRAGRTGHGPVTQRGTPPHGRRGPQRRRAPRRRAAPTRRDPIAHDHADPSGTGTLRRAADRRRVG